MNACRAVGIRFFCIIATALLLCSPSLAQYYPGPQPISRDRKHELFILLKKSGTDTNRVQVQLDLCNLYFNIPIKNKHDLDSAFYYARAAADLSTTLYYTAGYTRSQLFMADIFTVRNDMPAAENILKLVNDTAKIDLLLNLSFRYHQLINTKGDKNIGRCIETAEQARVLSIKLHLREKEALALKDIAAMHSDLQTSNAEKELLDVLKLYRSIGYPYLHYVYFELADLHFRIGNPDKALYYSLETIKSMKNTKDSLAASDFYLLHSAIYSNDDEYQTGIDFAKMAIESYKIHAGQFGLSMIIATVPPMYRNLKKYAEAIAFMKEMMKEFPPESYDDEIRYVMMMSHMYRELKQYPQAEEYCLRAIELQKKNGTLNQFSYKDLAQVYVEAGRFARAKPYLYKVLEYPLETVPLFQKRHLFYMLFLTDSATGDYLSAIKRRNVYTSLQDYELRQTKEKEVQKLNVQFETDKKLAAIKIKDQNIQLLTQDAKLQSVKLSEAKIIRNFTIGGIVLLLIITGLLFRQYWHKQKSSLAITYINQLISEKNDALEHLIKEKEWLLKEVHHRVKNNLHTVICLLESQAAYLDNDALKAIESSQHRIYAMSLIHQKLYQSEDVKSIDMDLYLQQFIQYLSDSFTGSNQIHFVLRVEPIRLGVQQAIPIALIINEAVTNSIKYAFPNNTDGEISITLGQYGDEIRLEVADNGIGMDPVIHDKESSSLGLQLIKGLSQELKARLEFNHQYGTRIVVVFMHDPLMDSRHHFNIPIEKEVSL